MKSNILSLALLALSAVTFTACEHDDLTQHHFENQLYITTEPVTDDLLIKADVTEASRKISVRTALPVSTDVSATLEAFPELANRYNLIYNDTAVALPAEHYEIPVKEFSIKSGDITTDDIEILFHNTNSLKADQRYVLPVKITSEQGIGVLESKRTAYFVFKGAALINVVANIKEMYFPVTWSSEAQNAVKHLSTVTVEALVRSKDWEAGRDNALSTVFGIEGNFLVRIGDADRPRDQLQLATSNGNWPAPNAAPGLPVDEWIHIAVVWDATTGERIYYQNGKQVAAGTGAAGTVDLDNNCFVGKAYDDSRWFPGEISELRVWNVQRTAEQIEQHIYQVDPATEGLLAYWKFNEGSGNIIKDHSSFKSDITAVGGVPTWIPVELPALN